MRANFSVGLNAIKFGEERAFLMKSECYGSLNLNKYNELTVYAYKNYIATYNLKMYTK